MLQNFPRLVRALTPIFGLMMVIGSPGLARAERPTSDELLPASTVAYLEISDIQDLVSRFQETAIGRIAREQQFKPLLAELYGFANEAYESAEQPAGLTLPELLSLPQGELTLAVVAPEEGNLAVVMLMDAGEKKTHLQTLIDRLEMMLQQGSAKRSTEIVDGTMLTVFETVGGSQQSLVHFLKESTLVIANNVEVARGLVATWNGDETRPSLRDNGDFANLRALSRGPRGESPQIQWFVDPIRLVKAIGRGNVGAQVGLAVLPVLGLDGVRGVGGSFTLATEEFDILVSAHVLLDQPRTGVLAMLALGNGDMTPESWVPNDVAGYRTLYWDVEKTYEELKTLFDSFQGEGALERNIQRGISDGIGVDFQQDVLAAIDGRFTHVTWFEPPATLESQAMLLGVRLKDADQSRKTLEKIVEKVAPRLKQETYAGIKYYEFSRPSLPADANQRADRGGESPRRPCVAIVGEYLLVADRPSFLQRAIVTRTDATKSLANELDFKLIASKLRRQSQGTSPSFLTFQRPEESLRTLYEIATGEESRRRLAQAAENNPFFATVHESLEGNPLPPFAVIKRYLAPGGGILTSDDSGIHYTGFGLRRK